MLVVLELLIQFLGIVVTTQAGIDIGRHIALDTLLPRGSNLGFLLSIRDHFEYLLAKELVKRRNQQCTMFVIGDDALKLGDTVALEFFGLAQCLVYQLENLVAELGVVPCRIVILIGLIFGILAVKHAIPRHVGSEHTGLEVTEQCPIFRTFF